MLVRVFVTVIVAPGIDAPLMSESTPPNVAVPVCAARVALRKRTSAPAFRALSIRVSSRETSNRQFLRSLRYDLARTASGCSDHQRTERRESRVRGISHRLMPGESCRSSKPRFPRVYATLRRMTTVYPDRFWLRREP